jgi:hypothetical protein
MGEGIEADKDSWRRGVDGAWGVAGTWLGRAWQEGVTATVNSRRQLFLLYSTSGLLGWRGGVALLE